MKRTLKNLACIAAALLLCGAFCVPLAAQGDFSQADELLGESGLPAVTAELPSQAREYLAQLGLAEPSVGAVLQLSPRQILRLAWLALCDAAKKPLLTGALAAGMLFCGAIFGGFGEGFLSKGLSGAFSVAMVLCVAGVLAQPVVSCMLRMQQVVAAGGRFMMGFVPIFTGAVIAAGQPVLAGSYSLLLLAAIEVITQSFWTAVLPLLFLYLGVSVVFCAVPGLSLGPVAQVVKSAATWLLGLMLAVFVGLLSLQGAVAASADSVALRAAKFAIGSMLPVVGGPVAEAFSSVLGSMGLIKSTVGVYGIVACLAVLLPVLAEALLWILTTKVLTAVAGMFGQKQAAEMLSAFAQALSVTLAVVVSFAMMLIVSTALVLSMKGGA